MDWALLVGYGGWSAQGVFSDRYGAQAVFGCGSGVAEDVTFLKRRRRMWWTRHDLFYWVLKSNMCSVE